MKKIQPIIVMALLTIVAPAQAEKMSVFVTRVIDGDSIVAITEDREEIRVRLTGIDCPEKRNEQPFWRAAKNQLNDWVASKTIEIEWNKQDRWERYIGVLWLDDHDVNANLVHLGMCWHFKKYQHEQAADDRELYSWLETEAKEQRLGLWADPDPIAPWVWRKRKAN